MEYAKSRHSEDAANTFDQAIKFDKANAMAYLERGKVWLAIGKTSKAIKDLEKAGELGSEEAKRLLNDH
jgi:tetratricopeptide (TPR) repeat protein